MAAPKPRKKKSNGTRTAPKRARSSAQGADKAPTYREGDPVKVLAPDAHKGEVVGVLEVDSDGKMVRTEFGWLTFEQVAPAPKSRATRMTVDGDDSNVVLDGKSGAPKAANGKAPKQLPLVEIPLEQLVHDFNNLAKQRDEAASKAGYWRGEVKLLNERIEPILGEIRRRDDASYGVESPSEQLSFTDDVEDEEDDDDEKFEQRRAVGTAVRSYPAGEGAE